MGVGVCVDVGLAVGVAVLVGVGVTSGGVSVGVGVCVDVGSAVGVAVLVGVTSGGVTVGVGGFGVQAEAIPVSNSIKPSIRVTHHLLRIADPSFSATRIYAGKTRPHRCFFYSSCL